MSSFPSSVSSQVHWASTPNSLTTMRVGATRSGRARDRLHQAIGEFHALIECLNADALVPAVGAIFVLVDPDAVHVVARDSGIACLSIVAEPGRHGRHQWNAWPHRVHDRGDEI